MAPLTTLSVHSAANGVCDVRMNRPQTYNAFDETMIAELDQVFSTLAEDPAVRIVVLSGAGKHFSAGADLQWMQRLGRATAQENLADARRFAQMLARIASFPKPTLARIQGVALGGGVGLTCCCDIAIAADTASFAVSEAKFGLMPATIGPHLANAIGARQARRLALTTERIPAAEALRLGMIHRTVPAEHLDDAVQATLADLLRAGPHAQAAIKQYFAALPTGPVSPETLELSATLNSRIRETPEAQEGFAAFLEKRPPQWITS
ncbi:Enoyl-CoA hydratase domain-containing protein 3, mitochondrial OS=Castellaniella defragrans OX=75697 GN=HNR28_000175 PE=3 SV=1 [Castellaniella defragrans]